MRKKYVEMSHKDVADHFNSLEKRVGTYWVNRGTKRTCMITESSNTQKIVTLKHENGRISTKVFSEFIKEYTPGKDY